MKNMRTTIGSLIVLVFCLSLVLSSVVCAAPKGELKIGIAQDLVGNWDPTQHTVVTMLQVEPTYFDFLVKVNIDGDLEPMLATSWKNIDPLTWEFKIRENVKFHNGSLLTSADVKSAIEYASSAKNPSSAWLPGEIKGRIVDDYTIRLITDKPAASLLYSLSMIPITNKEWVNNPEKFAETPNGTGPFKFVKFERDTLHLEANMDYWQGPPNLEKVQFQYIIDPSARLYLVKTGQIQIAGRLLSEQIPIIESDPNVVLEKNPIVEQMWLWFKCKKSPFKDNPTLRRAFAYAIDRAGITKYIMYEQAKESNSLLVPGVFGYAPASNMPSYNVEKAKELLAQAGYPNGQGLPPLKLMVAVGAWPKCKEYGEYIVENLQDIGIPIELFTVEIGRLGAICFDEEPEDYDLQITGWNPTGLEPDLFLRALFYSKPGRLSNIDVPEIDQTLDKELNILDLAEREQVIQNETIPTIVDYMPGLPLFQTVELKAVRQEVKGFKLLPSTVYDLHGVYIED